MSLRKILLMSLPAVLREGDTYLEDGHSFHLGLAYIGGLLREKGYHVRILDFYRHSLPGNQALFLLRRARLDQPR